MRPLFAIMISEKKCNSINVQNHYSFGYMMLVTPLTIAMHDSIE